MKKVYELEFYGRTLKVEVGELAKQANGAVIVRYDDTVILSSACCAKQAKTGIDFFPLTVTFEEKLYSVGKIPGSFLRREGRPSEHAVLTARIIDRPIRPLFDENFRNEVQIVNYALSVNPDVTPEMTALFGSSLALCISDIPFYTPVAGVKVGYVDGKFITNPTREEMEKSLIDLTVAGTKDALNMVEAGAKEVSEELMLEALMYGHEQIKKLVEFQETIVAEIGKEKMEVELFKIDEAIQAEVWAKCKEDLVAACRIEGKLARYNKIDELTQAVIDEYEAREYKEDEEHD